MTVVLVADPDPHARRIATGGLRFAGYTVEAIKTLASLRAAIRRRRPDAVILDPADGEAVEVISDLRAQTDIPIIVVSDPGEEWAKVAALDAGADDYLTKPFGLEELLARLRVAIRRTSGPDVDVPPVVTADFTIHLSDRRWIRPDGSEVRLTPTEWRLVEMLVRHAGHLVTQAELLRGVWGPDAVEKTDYLRVHIAAVRRKVEPEPARPRYFRTAPGLGLRFDAVPSTTSATSKEQPAS
jgi:two-component system KDP operon response regulator KdpE